MEALASQAKNLVTLYPGLKAKEHRQQLAEVHPSVPPTLIQRAFVAAGLFTVSQRGYAHYTTERPDNGARQGQSNGERAKDDSELSPEDEKILNAIMESLATIGTNFDQGRKRSEIIDYALKAAGTIGEDAEKTVRRNIHRLRNAGVITSVQSRQNAGVPKIRAVDAKMQEALKNAHLRPEILEAIKNNRKFQPPEAGK